MHRQLFAFLIAMCIAASYAKTPVGVSAVSEPLSSSVGTVIVTTANTSTVATDKKDKSEEEDDDKNKKFDHKHNATITVDVHNILDLFKLHLKQSEKRIITAVKDDSSSSSKESYHTVNRKAKKEEKKKEKKDDKKKLVDKDNHDD
jgi:hypothetical protein